MSKYRIQTVAGLHDPVSGALVGFLGADGKEYALGVAPMSAAGVAGTYTLTALDVIASGAGAGTSLTNPLMRGVNNVNNFTQTAIQNLSTGASSSSDHIAYPDNNTNDLTGFVDIGITSSGFADATYTVTGQNEAYLFGSAPSGVSKSGSLVIATDSTGTNNNIEFYVNGFNKTKTAFSARFLGTNGLLQVKEGLALTGKVVVANGATTTYTVPAKTNYVYLSTSAASLTITLPAASANIDGLLVIVCPSASVATVAWSSSGATVSALPTAFTANTPVRMVYDHGSTSWYPA